MTSERVGTRLESLPVYEVGRLGHAVLDQVGTVLVGKRHALELVLGGILAGGHVLLEDLPGLGKTLTARSFAQALGIEFRRLQFTPDLLPADVTGSFLYDQRNHDFTFRPGPVFTNLLLADEINRTPPKTQAALLEAMQEKQVSVEGTTYRLTAPFHVLATANPIEYEGTYPLPEAQLDRFLLRVSFGYPDREEEWGVLRRRVARRQEESFLDPVVDAGTLVSMQRALEDVMVEDSIGRYIVELTAATREHHQVLVGASPRGSLALLLLSRARAGLRDPGGRQGGGDPGAVPPDHAQAGDVAAPDAHVGDRGRGAGAHAGPRERRVAVLRRRCALRRADRRAPGAGAGAGAPQRGRALPVHRAAAAGVSDGPATPCGTAGRWWAPASQGRAAPLVADPRLRPGRPDRRDNAGQRDAAGPRRPGGPGGAVRARRGTGHLAAPDAGTSGGGHDGRRVHR